MVESMERNEHSGAEKGESEMTNDWSQRGWQREDPFVEDAPPAVVSTFCNPIDPRVA